MPRPIIYDIPVGLLAAARDGDLGLTAGAAQAGVSKQVFDYRLRKFKVEQARARSRKAITACAHWLAFCKPIGFPATELDDLEALWWSWHDENGNLLTARRR